MRITWETHGDNENNVRKHFDQAKAYQASHKRIQLTILFTNTIGNQPLEIPQKKKKNPKFQQNQILTKCINNNKQGSFERHYVIIIIIIIILIKLLKAFFIHNEM